MKELINCDLVMNNLLSKKIIIGMNSKGFKQDVAIVEKMVRLENQALPSRYEMTRIPFQYKPTNRMVYFDLALRTLINQGYSVEDSQIFFWDHVKRIFVYIGCFPSQNQLTVPYEYFQEGIIQIRYKKIVKQIDQLIQRHATSKRVKERSIKEAVEKVSQWMDLYERTDKSGRRIFTLQSAAKEVGVAKKTLDDYKTQIRLGQRYNFDFCKNNHSKIGVLRNYVKDMLTLNKLPSRPPSPEAEPTKIQAQAVIHGMMQQQSPGYLFHSTHSCYGSDSGSHRD